MRTDCATTTHIYTHTHRRKENGRRRRRRRRMCGAWTKNSPPDSIALYFQNWNLLKIPRRTIKLLSSKGTRCFPCNSRCFSSFDHVLLVGSMHSDGKGEVQWHFCNTQQLALKTTVNAIEKHPVFLGPIRTWKTHTYLINMFFLLNGFSFRATAIDLFSSIVEGDLIRTRRCTMRAHRVHRTADGRHFSLIAIAQLLIFGHKTFPDAVHSLA